MNLFPFPIQQNALVVLMQQPTISQKIEKKNLEKKQLKKIVKSLHNRNRCADRKGKKKCMLSLTSWLPLNASN